MAKTNSTKKTTTAKKTTKAVSAASKIVNAVTKKAAKKESASATKTSVVIQYAGKDLSYDELIQNAKNVFQYDIAGDPASIKEISLFVKPEENKVYFVIDGTEGSYDL